MDKGRFETEIRRLDAILREREKQAERDQAEALRARLAANEWRAALIEREQSYARQSSLSLLQDHVDRVDARLDEATGRRVALTAAAGVIATLLAIGVGQIIRQGITSADVSQQIQREAPWNRDKAQVERRITSLEREVQVLQVRLSKLEDGRR